MSWAIYIPTTSFTKAYLEYAWKNRGSLGRYERNGFSQFFYLTISGHIEALMCDVVDRRLMSMRMSVFRDEELQEKITDEAERRYAKETYESMRAVLNNFEKRIERTSYNHLRELIPDVFGKKLNTLMGDAARDLNAIFDLRNIFAHGRYLSANHDADDDTYNFSEEKNPLKEAASVLLDAGILKKEKFSLSSHEELIMVFYSDEAMLYFLEKAKFIEDKIKSLLIDGSETGMPFMINLPTLA